MKKHLITTVIFVFLLAACRSPAPTPLLLENTPLITAPAPTAMEMLLIPTLTGLPVPSSTPAPTATVALEPLATVIEPTPEAGEFAEFLCDSFTSHLTVNASAVLNPFPPVPNRVREAPALASEQIGQILPADRLQVLDGPRCADGYTWWKVRVNPENLIGWTIEGDQDEDWLIPFSAAGYTLQFQPVPENWEVYVNTAWGFTFRHPSMSECCSMGGPLFNNPTELITLAEAGTDANGNGKPFNGFAVHGVVLKAPMTFGEYMQKELQEFAGLCQTCTGQAHTLTIGGREATLLQGYSIWGIQNLYILLADGRSVLVISWGENLEGSFETTLTQIFSTFRFIYH